MPMKDNTKILKAATINSVHQKINKYINIDLGYLQSLGAATAAWRACNIWRWLLK